MCIVYIGIYIVHSISKLVSSPVCVFVCEHGALSKCVCYVLVCVLCVCFHIATIHERHSQHTTYSPADTGSESARRALSVRTAHNTPNPQTEQATANAASNSTQRLELTTTTRTRTRDIACRHRC